HDCRIATWELDPLGAAADADLDAIATAERLLEMGDAPEARAHLMNALTTTSGEARARMYFLLGLVEARHGAHSASLEAFAAVEPSTCASRYNAALAARDGSPTLAVQLLDDLLGDVLEARLGTENLDHALENHSQLPSDATGAIQ